MKRYKKGMQGILVMLLTAVMMVSSLIQSTPQISEAKNVQVAQNGQAGIVASLAQTENAALDQVLLADVAVEKTETQIVTVASRSEAAAEQETSEAVAEVSGAAVEASAEEVSGAAVEASGAAIESDEQSELMEEWQDKVMADVDDSLSVRAKGNANAKLVGKMYPTSVATVIKQGKKWTKIKSGDVKGYVKTEYLLFGMDAYKNAKKVCKTYAYVQTDGLRIRNKANKKAKVLSVADKGDRLLFDKDAEVADGWVAVSVKAGDGYVSADYVKVKLGTTDAVSMEELEAQQAKKESATQNAATSASSSDVTLLAAIIYCEAGSECYEGKVAVGAVVLNRVHSSSFANSISGVIYQRGQFGPASNGTLARVLASGSISSSCRQAAADALAGSDPTGGKLFFHRANGRAGVVIGNHVFY